MDQDRKRKLALERQHRYLARKRGESVPKLPGGRPRKAVSLESEGWESFLHTGAQAVFLGTVSGVTHWQLGDPQKRVAAHIQLPEGGATWKALEQFCAAGVSIAAVETSERQLAEICRAASESIKQASDASPDRKMLQISLRVVADLMEHGRFVPQDGEIYHRVEGGEAE